ncbi:hypothetical protein ACFLVE_04050 [Chloroflexota bacterium]
MPFQKGNTAHKDRKVRSGGGRIPSPVKVERDALARDKQNVFKYLKVISDMALNSQDTKLALQACIYLIDRHLGKAKQTQDVSVTPQPFTQDDIDLMAQVKIAEQKLLAQVDDNIGNPEIELAGQEDWLENTELDTIE